MKLMQESTNHFGRSHELSKPTKIVERHKKTVKLGCGSTVLSFFVGVIGVILAVGFVLFMLSALLIG